MAVLHGCAFTHILLWRQHLWLYVMGVQTHIHMCRYTHNFLIYIFIYMYVYRDTYLYIWIHISPKISQLKYNTVSRRTTTWRAGHWDLDLSERVVTSPGQSLFILSYPAHIHFLHALTVSNLSDYWMWYETCVTCHVKHELQFTVTCHVKQSYNSRNRWGSVPILL